MSISRLNLCILVMWVVILMLDVFAGNWNAVLPCVMVLVLLLEKEAKS